MAINQIILDIMVVCMAIAAIDRVVGTPLGIGDKLEEGVAAIGPLCIPMVGMMELAPLLGKLMTPVVTPVYHALGADPAMAANSLLACDMGGYSLAYAIADTEAGAQFSGCILGTMLGSIITFMIPVGIQFVKPSYQNYYVLGLLIGIISVPAGLFVGGLAAGYSVGMVAHNTLPVLLFSALVALGLWKAQNLCIKIFKVFGYIVVGVSTLGFAIGIAQELTPMQILDDLPSVLDGIRIVGGIAIVLCGAFPMVELIRRTFQQPFTKLGAHIGVDDVAVTSMLACMANVVPLLKNCNAMSPAGVVVSMAFCVGANSMLGDFLGFVAGVDASMIAPMMLSNIVSALVALPIAVLVCKGKHLSAVCEKETHRKYKVKRRPDV